MTGVWEYGNQRERNLNLSFCDKFKSAALIAENFGTLHGTATASDDGRVLVDGSGYVYYALSGELSGNAITQFVRFTPDFVPNDGARTRYLTTSETANNRIVFLLSGYLQIRVGGTQIFYINFDAYKHAWNYEGYNSIVAVAVSGGRNTLYINGNNVTSNLTAWSSNPDAVLYIGGVGPTGSLDFNGTIHSYKAFRTALEPAELKDLCTYGELPNITRTHVTTDDVFKTAFGIYDNTTAITSDFISGSPFEVVSGSYTVEREVIDGVTTKVIEWGGFGETKLPTSAFKQSPSDAAYGTTRFYLNTDISSDSLIRFIGREIQEVPGEYRLSLKQDGTIVLIATGVAVLYTSDAGVWSHGVWNEITFHVSATDDITVCVNGVECINVNHGSGKLSNNIYIKCPAGSKLAYASLDGSHAIVKET